MQMKIIIYENHNSRIPCIWKTSIVLYKTLLKMNGWSQLSVEGGQLASCTEISFCAKVHWHLSHCSH